MPAMKPDAHINRAATKRRGKQYAAAVILSVAIGAALGLLSAAWAAGCPAYARLSDALGESQQAGQCGPLSGK